MSWGLGCGKGLGEEEGVGKREFWRVFEKWEVLVEIRFGPIFKKVHHPFFIIRSSSSNLASWPLSLQAQPLHDSPPPKPPETFHNQYIPKHHTAHSDLYWLQSRPNSVQLQCDISSRHLISRFIPHHHTCHVPKLSYSMVSSSNNIGRINIYSSIVNQSNLIPSLPSTPRARPSTFSHVMYDFYDNVILHW